MDASDSRKKIRQYILENYLFTQDDSQLTDQDSFLEKGIMDSTGILEVIFFLEENYQISVTDEEMIPENLDSVDSLLQYIQRKCA